jgi:hypothetical protein
MIEMSRNFATSQALLILEFGQLFFPMILSEVISIIHTLSECTHARVIVLIGDIQTQISIVATIPQASPEVRLPFALFKSRSLST